MDKDIQEWLSVNIIQNALEVYQRVSLIQGQAQFHCKRDTSYIWKKRIFTGHKEKIFFHYDKQCIKGTKVKTT